MRKKKNQSFDEGKKLALNRIKSDAKKPFTKIKKNKIEFAQQQR